MARPKLIIIQGAPAAGKTTLSRELKRRLHNVLLISKDEIKEFLFNTQPPGDREWSRVLGEASITAMYGMGGVLLRSGRRVMLESAFNPAYARIDIENLNADVIEVLCVCEPDILRQRFLLRAATDRHPGHLDSTTDYDGAAAAAACTPVGIGRTLTIDTTYGVTEAQYDILTRKLTDFLEEI